MVGATIEEGPLIRGGFLSIMVMISILNLRISMGKSGCRKGEGGGGAEGSAMQSASYDARDIYNFYGITICYVINECILIRKSAAVLPSLNSRASTALSGGMR